MAHITTNMRPSHKRQRLSRPDDDDVPQFHPIPKLDDVYVSNAMASRSQPAPSKQDWPVSPALKADSEETSAPANGLPGVVIPPELVHLKLHHDIVSMKVMSSSKIQHKVAQLLKHLSQFSFADLHAKPGLVILWAPAQCAGKLVSIIEIAKREIAGQEGKLYQYSRVSGMLAEYTPKNMNENVKDGKRLGGNDKGEKQATESIEIQQSGSEEESEPAFETMKTKERKKVRAVPHLTVYLSRVPVPDLKEKYGEQMSH